MKDNLEILITKCIENDRVGQQKIYQLFAPVLYGLCLKYMKNEDDAKDVFQEAFVIAYQKMYQFKFEGSFEGWLKRIFIYKCIETLKKNRKNLFLLDGYDYPIDESFEEEEIDKLSLSEEKLLEYIQDLPDQYRLVFNLYVFEKLKHREISVMLNITESTSKSNLNRAKTHLKRRILAAFNSKTA